MDVYKLVGTWEKILMTTPILQSIRTASETPPSLTFHYLATPDEEHLCLRLAVSGLSKAGKSGDGKK